MKKKTPTSVVLDLDGGLLAFLIAPSCYQKDKIPS
jgi:hypothetical protein